MTNDDYQPQEWRQAINSPATPARDRRFATTRIMRVASDRTQPVKDRPAGASSAAVTP